MFVCLSQRGERDGNSFVSFKMAHGSLGSADRISICGFLTLFSFPIKDDVMC
jgi:hypothetical protein